MKIFMIKNHMTEQIKSSAGAYPSKERAYKACYELALRRAKQAESEYPDKEVVVEREHSDFNKSDRFKAIAKNGKYDDVIAIFRVVGIQFYEEP